MKLTQTRPPTEPAPAGTERFCRLDPRWGYEPCRWDFNIHHAARDHFIGFFRAQYARSMMLAQRQAVAAGRDAADVTRRLEKSRILFEDHLQRVLAGEVPGRTTILSIDYVRDDLLRRAGFADPYYTVKHHDNEEVLALLPGVCSDIDAHPEPLRLQAVIAGALAGNIFDMGVAATADRMLQKTLSFVHTRDSLPPRPWLVDDFELLARRMFNGPAHKKAVIFVDNAGADFVLGMLPLARYLGQRGTKVILVGNELPSLNDMTLADIQEIWPEVLAAEPSLAKLPITLASSGTGEPLIDLGAVAPELNRLSEDADLVVLEGMGRALESNFFARFDCEVLKIAMIKDDFVARSLGGKLYDVVCRFELPRT